MTTVFKITHLNCASCAIAMEGICEDVPGVTKAEVHVGRKQLQVEHGDTVQVDLLQAALAKEGYPVEVA